MNLALLPPSAICVLTLTFVWCPKCRLLCAPLRAMCIKCVCSSPSCRSPQRGVARWHPGFVHCLQVQRWHYGCIVTISSTVSADLPFAVTRCRILWFLKLCNLTLKVAFVVSPMLEGLSARRSAVRLSYAGTCMHGRRAIHSHQECHAGVYPQSVRTFHVD